MTDELYPFELDGVTVLSETEIRHEGRIWKAGHGSLVGQWMLRPSWLRQGGQVEDTTEGELWISGDETLEPSVGPAWVGFAYVPTPSYVKEQVIRRRAGLPLRERQWVDIGPNPRRRGGPSRFC